MPTYTFHCGCGWRGDRRARYGDNSVPCPSCGLTAAKESVYRLNFGGFAKTPSHERDLSRDFKRYDEAAQEIEYKHERLTEAAGREIAPPPLYRMAKRRAKQLLAQGATVDDLP